MQSGLAHHNMANKYIWENNNNQLKIRITGYLNVSLYSNHMYFVYNMIYFPRFSPIRSFIQNYLSTICFPKGINEISISLKCCLAKGIPTTVKNKRIPMTKCPMAIQSPPQRIQIILNNKDKGPFAVSLFIAIRPNGQRTNPAILKH